MCEEKNLVQLKEYITKFRKIYTTERTKWETIVNQNVSLEERLANPEIQQYIKIILTNVQEEHRQTETLLKNVLPEEIIPYLQNQTEIYAERFDNISILFADIVGFTRMSEKLDPHDMVMLLNEIFSNFDHYLAEFDVEKIRTIGDNYMVSVGAPRKHQQPTKQIAQYALCISKYLEQNSTSFKGRSFRIGINTGEVIAAVVGTDMYNFDVWGDAVNVAARMESHGVPGKIQVTEKVYLELKDEFEFKERGVIDIKGKEPMNTWFLLKEK